MKIQYNKTGLVDFQNPINVTDEQKEKIIHYLKQKIPSLTIMNIKEKVRDAPTGPRTSSKWTPEEYLLLLKTFDPVLVAERTQHGDGVGLKMAYVIPAFLNWLKTRGKLGAIHDEDTIKLFLQEWGALK